MKRNILSFVNKLQSYKTAIKNLHWSSKNMSEHKLWDEIADTVADTQDEIAEMAQGIFGNIELNELKPRRYNITNSKKTLSDMLKDTKLFYSTVKRGEQFIGIRSEIENFIGQLEKYQYLMNFCLKEDIKRNIKNSLTESKQNVKSFTGKEFKKLIKEAIDDKEIEIDASWNAFEKTRQPESRYSIKGNLDTELDGHDSWYDYGHDKYDDVMNYDEDDMFDEYHEFAKDDDGFNGMQAQLDDLGHKMYYQDRFKNDKTTKLDRYV